MGFPVYEDQPWCVLWTFSTNDYKLSKFSSILASFFGERPSFSYLVMFWSPYDGFQNFQSVVLEHVMVCRKTMLNTVCLRWRIPTVVTSNGGSLAFETSGQVMLCMEARDKVRKTKAISHVLIFLDRDDRLNVKSKQYIGQSKPKGWTIHWKPKWHAWVIMK